MKYRKLRIGWSIAWGIVAVLLCVLWVRSYSHLATNQILVTASKRYYLHSFSGTVALQVWSREFIGYELMPIFRESDLAEWLVPSAGIRVVRSWGFEIDAISIRYWLLTAGGLISASLPWLRWRFSLRTLLIATMLVAIGLGLIVWLR